MLNKIKSMSIYLLMFVLIASTSGCASRIGGNQVNANNANVIGNVYHGVVTSVAMVHVNEDTSNQYLGAAAGGIVGGILGSLFGGGSGKTVATVAGAALGAGAGYYGTDAATKQNAYRIEVKLDSGRNIVVVQGLDQTFSAGQKVSVTETNGVAKVTPR